MSLQTMVIGGVAKKLVPLTEYSKPLLKMGKQDRSFIWSLSKRNNFYEKQIADLEHELGLPGLSNNRKRDLKAKIEKLIKQINENNLTIREAKVNAYSNQLAGANFKAVG